MIAAAGICYPAHCSKMARPHSSGYDYEHIQPHSPLAGTPFGGTPALSRRGSFEYHPSPAASTTNLVNRTSMNGRDNYNAGLQRLRPTLDKNHSTYYNGSQTNLNGSEMDYMIPESDLSDEDKMYEEDSSSTIIGSTPDMKHDNRFSSTSSFGQKYSDTEYVIAELAKHDDNALISPWKRRLHRMAPLFTIAALGGYYVYYAFRIYYTVEAQRAYGKVFPMAWVFIVAECLVTGESTERTYPLLNGNLATVVLR